MRVLCIGLLVAVLGISVAGVLMLLIPSTPPAQNCCNTVIVTHTQTHTHTYAETCTHTDIRAGTQAGHKVQRTRMHVDMQGSYVCVCLCVCVCVCSCVQWVCVPSMLWNCDAALADY